MGFPPSPKVLGFHPIDTMKMTNDELMKSVCKYHEDYFCAIAALLSDPLRSEQMAGMITACSSMNVLLLVITKQNCDDYLAKFREAYFYEKNLKEEKEKNGK